MGNTIVFQKFTVEKCTAGFYQQHKFAFFTINVEQLNTMQQTDFMHKMHSLACLLTRFGNARLEMYKQVSLPGLSVFPSEHYSAKKFKNHIQNFVYFLGFKWIKLLHSINVLRNI